MFCRLPSLDSKLVIRKLFIKVKVVSQLDDDAKKKSILGISAPVHVVYRRWYEGIFEY
jgi:hypothetical protein